MFEYEKDAIILKFKKCQDEHAKTLRSGLLKNFEEYKLVVGKIYGIEEAINCLEKVYNDLINGENYGSRTIK